jgi:3-oxoacyl-[acyl-carrier protein] reductase
MAPGTPPAAAGRYPDLAGRVAPSFPLRRIGQPEDVAAATRFLASDASAWITGVTLDIAGGKIMVMV